MSGLEFPPFVLDLDSGDLLRAGEPVALPALPARLLRYLALNRHRIVPHAELEQAIWKGRVVEEATLHQAIRQARRAVDDDGRRQHVIRTKPGRGYRFVAETAQDAPPPEPAQAAPYVGRAALLADLATSVRSAAAGRTTGVLLAGEAGIGKTRTLLEVERLATASGMLVLRGQAGRRADGPPWQPWADVLSGLGTARPADWFAEIEKRLRASGGTVTPDDGESIRSHLIELVCRGLEREATRGPIAILLEDMHDASAATFEMCESVLRATGRMALLLVATFRSSGLAASPPHTRVRETLSSYTNVTELELSPLSEIETAYLIEQQVPRSLETEAIRALARHADGSPFFAHEIARLLPDDPSIRTAADLNAWVPRGAEQLLRSRIAALDASAREVLEVASASGSHFEETVLREAVPEHDVRAALEQARSLKLIVPEGRESQTWRFAHELIREALEARLGRDAGALRRAHVRIADALASLRPHATGAIAHHLCEASPEVDAGRLVGAVRGAADEAMRGGDLSSALEIRLAGLRALEHNGLPSERAVCELLVEAGEAGIHGEAPEEVRGRLGRALSIARRIGAPDLIGRAVLTLAHRPEIVGVRDAALVALLEDAAEQTHDGQPSLSARLRSRAAIEIRYEDGGLQRASDIIEDAISLARHSGDALATAQVLEDATLVRWSVGDPEGWRDLNHQIVEAATEAGHAMLRFQGEKGLATAHLELGHRQAYDRALAACEQIAAEFSTPFVRAVATGLLGGRALLEGDLATGERLALESASSGLPSVAPLAAGQLYYHRLETGQLAELEDAVRVFAASSPGVATWRVALARLLLDADRLEEARDEIASLPDVERIPQDRNWYPALAMLAECSVRLGDRALGERVDRAIAPYSRVNVVLGNGAVFYGNGAHFRGMLAALRGDAEAAGAHLASALAAHEALGAEAWVLHTRAEHAHLLDAAGDTEAAARIGEDVASRCRKLGMIRCAARAERACATGDARAS